LGLSLAGMVGSFAMHLYYDRDQSIIRLKKGQKAYVENY